MIRLFPFFIQERLGFDLNMFEQSFPEIEVQKKVFKTYSSFLITGQDWRTQSEKEKKDFQNFISNNLIFSQDEINILFNDECPEMEDFFEVYNMVEKTNKDQWPNENYLSEYLEYRNKPTSTYNGFSTSQNV
jgi:hypothetical protein